MMIGEDCRNVSIEFYLYERSTSLPTLWRKNPRHIKRRALMQFWFKTYVYLNSTRQWKKLTIEDTILIVYHLILVTTTSLRRIYLCPLPVVSDPSIIVS